MHLYCVYTPAHEVLLRNWFLPSVPAGFDVTATALEISGAGDFLSDEFLRCIRAKIALIVDSIQSNRGSWIVWSDVDILLHQGTKEALEQVIRDAGECELFSSEKPAAEEKSTPASS